MPARETFPGRRRFLAGSAALAAAAFAGWKAQRPPALIAITLDLEMSREYPQRGMLEWDYEKGNLDAATKQYAAEAGRVAKELGGQIHYFCVGRVLEQPDVEWLKKLHADGHPVGNHTYDHVYLLASTPEEIQFRFRRAPWLIAGRSVPEVIEENIRITSAAMQARLGFGPDGFRTPGGFANGLAGRPDLQKMLLAQGFPWVSSKYPAHPMGKPKEQPGADVLRGIIEAQQAAQPFRYDTGLIEIPMSPVSDVNAFRSNYWKLDWFLDAVGRAVDWAIETGGVFDFLAHPSCLVVEDPEFQTIKRICRKVADAGDRARIVGLSTVAERAAG